VRDYIPEFRLHDAVATDRVTVRDLLCHHSGLPRHDWIWLPGDLSPAQMLTAMRYLEPSGDIRSTFQYSNLGYLVASIVTERVSGQSWSEFTRVRLTDKLRMNVTFTVEDLAAAADAAMPYAMDEDTRLRSKLCPMRATAAGGINTSIANFANWLRLHLDKGEFEGQRLLPPTLIQELQTPRVHVAASEFTEHGDVHYGLGFRSHSYRGERAVWHGGGWSGWSTLMTMLPNRGVVLLCSLIVLKAWFRKFSPITSSTECAAKSQYPGSIVFVSVAANSRRSSKSTDRTGKRRGGQTRDLAMTSRIMLMITSIPATAGSQLLMPKAN
jgi:CubicO group peptidase (beta-lactamase class C family)